MNKVNFASYADDNTPYTPNKASDELFCWFANNQMKANPNKCHLITGSSNEVTIYVENYIIKSSKWEKLLSIKIANKLNFN